MASPNEIVNAAGYVGNAALGGGSFGSFELDTKPVQQLAQYTYLFNRAEYEQRQKNADEKLQELAKLTAYNLKDGIRKDKDEVIGAMADLQKYGAEFAALPSPKTPVEKIKQQIEYQGKIADAEKKINSANARAIAYDVRKNQILQGADDAAIKAEKIKALDDEFDSTDIYTKISLEPKFDLAVPKVAPPVSKKTDVVIITPDGNIDETVSFFDRKSNMNAAFLESNGFDLQEPAPNATALEKQEFKLKSKVKDGNKIWQDAAKFLNTALSDPKYSKEVTAPVTGEPSSVPQIDVNKIKSENPIVGNILDLVERHNAYMADRKQDAINGFYTDKYGHKIQLLQTVRPEDFEPIDVSKGLTPVDIVYLEKFAKASPDTKEEKFNYTGDATRLRLEQIQQAGANTRARIGEAGQNERARLPYIMAKMGTGSATKSELSEYPILKTEELVETIGTAGAEKKFNELTPEQQGKISEQVGERITDLSTATISIIDGKIKVSGELKDKGKVVVNIIPDDITKAFYTEINKNDAGKEAPERRYFKLGDVKTLPAADTSQKTAAGLPILK